MQGIGLLGLLVVVALIFYLMFAAGGKGSAGAALEAQKTVRPQVEQIGGKDADGRLATETLTFETGPKGVVVTTVEKGAAFDQKFGIQAGDVILQIGPLTKDQFQDDRTAKAFLHDAYARDETILVQRGPLRLNLPEQRNEQPSAATPADAQPAQPPAAAAPPPPQQRATPRGQLNDILKRRDENGVPTH